MPRFVTIQDPRHSESIVREAFKLGDRRLSAADIAKGMEALVRRNPSLGDPQRMRPGAVIVVPEEAVFEPERPVERPGGGRTGGGRTGGGGSAETGGGTRAGTGRETLRVGAQAAGGVRLIDPALLGAVPKADRFDELRSAAEELAAQLKGGMESAGGALAEETKLVAALRKAHPDDAVVKRELDEIEQGIQRRTELAKDRVKRSAKAIDGLLGRLEELRGRFGGR